MFDEFLKKRHELVMQGKHIEANRLFLYFIGNSGIDFTNKPEIRNLIKINEIMFDFDSLTKLR